MLSANSGPGSPGSALVVLTTPDRLYAAGRVACVLRLLHRLEEEATRKSESAGGLPTLRSLLRAANIT
ncbi:MAG: hypothetical protein ACM3XZ_04595 [Betaproteobacteria bacterium]